MRRFILSSLSLFALVGCSSQPSGSVSTTASPQLTVTSESEVVEPTVSSTLDTSETELTNDALIIYFSNTGNTESVATVLQAITDADIVRIEPAIPYTEADLDYTNDDCRANQEQNDDSSRPEIANTIDIDGYTTIYLGFPIWWGSAPRIIQTLLETYDFSGKTIAPFCTSGSSGITNAVALIEATVPNATVTQGARIDVDQAQDQLQQWLQTIGLDD